MIPCICISFFLTVFFVRGTSLKREDDARLQEEGKEWAAKHRTRDRLKFGTQKQSRQASDTGDKKEEIAELANSGNRKSSNEGDPAEQNHK